MGNFIDSGGMFSFSLFDQNTNKKFSALYLELFDWKVEGLMISYDLIKFMVIKLLCLHGFNISVHTIIMAGQTTPPEDQINNIEHVICGAQLWLKVFQIVSLIPDITKSLQYCSLLDMGTWVISIQTFLFFIFVIKGSCRSASSSFTCNMVG